MGWRVMIYVLNETQRRAGDEMKNSYENNFDSTRHGCRLWIQYTQIESE